MPGNGSPERIRRSGPSSPSIGTRISSWTFHRHASRSAPWRSVQLQNVRPTVRHRGSIALPVEAGYAPVMVVVWLPIHVTRSMLTAPRARRQAW